MPTPIRAEKTIWLFFGVTCIQLTFLCPYIVMVPGERTNLFSGLLCFLSLVVAVIFAGRGVVRVKSPEFLFSAALTVLAVASSLASQPPLAPAFFRVGVMLASGLGGFWCARILLATEENQRRFQHLCLFLLGGVLLVSLLGYFRHYQSIHYYILTDSNHPLVNLIFLLSFAPFALLWRRPRQQLWWGVSLLVLSYVVLCLSQRLSVIFIPLGLAVIAVLFGALRWKHLLAFLLGIGVLVGLFSQQILWFKLSKEYPAYRIENFFFSMTIVKQHPLLGIGLRTPKNQYLKDYQIKYPYKTKEQFSKDVTHLVTADNQILTLMTGLGLPFTIIYCLAVLLLLARLTRIAFRPPPGLYLPPLAILFPLAMALVHWQLYDGLLFAQDNWFFHILLGLIPAGNSAPASTGAAWSSPVPVGVQRADEAGNGQA